MPLTIRSPFYGNPAGQVVPQAEQAALALFDRLDLMTANVARSARRLAPTGAHNDGGFVLSVFMVQTIGRKRATLCRVRERHCCHSLPSEPDVKVSLHPAQAVAKPRVSGAGSHDGLIPASWRWIPNFLKNARSSKYPCQSGSNGLASARIFT